MPCEKKGKPDMKAVAYTRFSPRRNAETSESCEIQMAYIEQHAAKRGHEIVAAFHDKDVSGKDEYREKLWKAIQALTRGGILLVYRRDRLARNVFLSEQINRAVKSRGANIEAVTGDVEGDGPEHTMIRQVLASVHEYERKLIGIRTSYAMKQHQANGRRVSKMPPYGFMEDALNPSRLIENPDERETIAEVVRLKDEGLTPFQIAKALDPAKARFGKWNPITVSRILRRAADR